MAQEKKKDLKGYLRDIRGEEHLAPIIDAMKELGCTKEDFNKIEESVKNKFINKGYKEEKLSDMNFAMIYLDPFLIKATRLYFENKKGDLRKRDIVLLAFGLLKGYEYQKWKHVDRQSNFLTNTDYLKLGKSLSDAEDFAIEYIPPKTISALADKEQNYIEDLAEYLRTISNIVDYAKDIDDYIQYPPEEYAPNKYSPVICPTTAYGKREKLVTRSLVIKYGVKVLTELTDIKKYLGTPPNKKHGGTLTSKLDELRTDFKNFYINKISIKVPRVVNLAIKFILNILKVLFSCMAWGLKKTGKVFLSSAVTVGLLFLILRNNNSFVAPVRHMLLSDSKLDSLSTETTDYRTPRDYNDSLESPTPPPGEDFPSNISDGIYVVDVSTKKTHK